MTHHGPNSRETTTFPHIVLSALLHGTYIRMALFPGTPKEEFRNCSGLDSRDSQGRVSKLFRFRLPGHWEFITLCLDLWLRWSLNQTCSSPQELSNGVLHSTRTHQGRIDSQLLVLEVKLPVWPPALLLCLTCAIDVRIIHARPFSTSTFSTSMRPFQQYNFKARFFNPCNRALKIWKSRRTPKSPFQECECHPHTPSKWGCDK
jgi:hypothetical protein